MRPPLFWPGGHRWHAYPLNIIAQFMKSKIIWDSNIFDHQKWSKGGWLGVKMFLQAWSATSLVTIFLRLCIGDPSTSKSCLQVTQVSPQATPAPSASVATASTAIATVSLKLPSFWSFDWFQLAEVQFLTHSITAQRTKFYHVITSLSRICYRGLWSLLLTPPSYWWAAHKMYHCFRAEKAAAAVQHRGNRRQKAFTAPT